MAILHLHRQHIMIAERARIHLDNGRVVYSSAEETGVVRSWNIPTLNSCAVLLGQGASITTAAARKLAEDEVMLGFTGTAGTPFLMGSMEYRPTDRVQKWVSAWQDVNWRLKASRILQEERCKATKAAWTHFSKTSDFRSRSFGALTTFEAKIRRARSIAELMGFEGTCVKSLYQEAAKATKLQWNGREHQSSLDLANRYLDHGNYLAYGIASMVLWTYGIPPSFPITHGASRSGGLVFDLADAFKDAIVLPTAFQCAADPESTDQQFRDLLIERLHDASFLDRNGTIGFAFAVMDRLIDSIEDEAAT